MGISDHILIARRERERREREAAGQQTVGEAPEERAPEEADDAAQEAWGPEEDEA